MGVTRRRGGMAGDGNLARRPRAKSSLTPFLPYCLTTGGGCDFRSMLEAAAAEEAAAFAADLVLPSKLPTSRA